MADRKRKPEENPVIEWISDNLRYIELGAGIIVIILILIFAIRAFSGKDKKADNTQNTAAAVSAVEEVSAASADAAETVRTMPTAAVSEEEPEKEYVPDQTLVTDNAEVNKAVEDYFANLTAAGNNGAIESYTKPAVWAAEGPEEGTYVAFASYEYRYADFDAQIPALTELFVKTDASGMAWIATDLTAEEEAYMEALLENEDVTFLVEDVQGDYATALEINDGLQEFIDGLDQ